MKRFFISFLMIVAAVTVTKAQFTYDGQCVNIMLESGDSISHDLAINSGLNPQVKDGKIVWNILFSTSWGDIVHTLDNVTSIEYRSPEQVREQVRKALVEFYQATNGDQWNNNTNWCSDKPLEEWFGVKMGYHNAYPYVTNLELSGNNLSGHLPDGDCLLRLGGINGLYLWDNNIGGNIPQCLEHCYSLSGFFMDRNQLTGEIPAYLFDLPYLSYFEVADNKLTGPIPANFSHLMDQGFNKDLSGNDLSGEVPESIVNHPRFSQLWEYILPQSGHLSLPDIPAPVLDVTDLNGNHYSTKDVYKDNILTLLYTYSSAKSGFTDKLAKAYEVYKPKGFEVLGMITSEPETIMPYLYENGINWLNLDPEGFTGFFNRYFLYLNFVNLVDQNGNIVFTSLMDENGKMEDTGWGGSTRDQLMFDVLEKTFGAVDYTPYASTDYSADGEVITLQKATKGLGVDIVFVGNAFTDKDMAPGGKYEKKMKEAMEQFFAYEPYTSLRDRFNVYAVKAVSANHEIFEGTSQAIASNEDAFAYAQKIKDLIPDRPLRVNVIYDSYNAGRSVCYMYDDASYVAYMFTGVNRVLNHEGGGHGVGRLLDEYVEDNANSVPSAEVKEYIEKDWTDFGRGANIDLHSDVTQTRWSHLAADSRYAAEHLGAYEGAGTYGRDVYRPTENSMMRYNNIPFNAPSREAIYKYVMQESEGPDWVYDYETFVAFDEPGRQQFVNAQRTAAARGNDSVSDYDKATRPLPPVFVSGTWKDAMKNKKE
jgi:hypothetical protein